MKNKGKIIVAAVVAAALLFVSGIFVGYTFCKRAQYKGVISQQKEDAESVMNHEENKDEVDKKVAKIKTENKKIVDPTGCLRVPQSDEYIDGLLRADRAAKSIFN